MGDSLEQGDPLSASCKPVSRELLLEDRGDTGARWTVGGGSEPGQFHQDVLLACRPHCHPDQDSDAHQDSDADVPADDYASGADGYASGADGYA